MLAPEILVTTPAEYHLDLTDAKYAEAYEEMGFYNSVGHAEAKEITHTPDYHALSAVADAEPSEVDFPNPWQLWIDSRYDGAAQWDAYSHLAPIKDQRVLQLGGKGLHVVKFLLAGAAEGWLVTPMVGEIDFACALARAFGVADRLKYAAAVAEELPFADASFDRIYSGGCLHHMETVDALPEIARVLKDSGKFGAVDPWRAPLHDVGTTLMGKREPNVHCRPLTHSRLKPLAPHFRASRVILHGTLTRYCLLALDKLGLESPRRFAWAVAKSDDALSTVLGIRRFGSSAAVLGTK